MFERYTEKARRVIFFARYEASEFGTSEIATEHILLGIMREDKALLRLIPKLQFEAVRKQIKALSPVLQKIPTSIDLPLAKESKRVLDFAAEEAERLASKPITPAHMLLGLLREKSGLAASLLRDYGVSISDLRQAVAKLPSATDDGGAMIEIHGHPYDDGYIESAVRQALPYSWQHRKFVAPDIVVRREGRQISFDLKLADNSSEFELVKRGWKQTQCIICAWDFEESDDPETGSGYTNGRDWMCSECHDKFMIKLEE